MKTFNTTGVCIPSKHYMVDISDKVKKIKKMVDAGEYFTINRARQYGKTTTLNALRKALASDYEMVGLDFQRLGSSSFRTEESFCRSFVRQILNKVGYGLISIPEAIVDQMTYFVSSQNVDDKLEDLMRIIQKWCGGSKLPVVLMIDEVDYATNFQVFLDFLAQLRAGYISRDSEGIPTFQSVIFAGVTDVRCLSGRIRGEDQYRINSPWNIAADFDIDMSLSEAGIKGMLDEYEADYQTGMDTGSIAKLIREYTNGYPFLVSRICQLIDKQVVKNTGVAVAWTHAGLYEAIKLLLFDDNTLFYLLMSNLKNYPDL